MVWPMVALGQFVFPRPEYHKHDPNVYKEDPFVVHYRHEFFAVFSGDFGRFEKAFGEIKAMVAKNPSYARALVWMGNGDTVEAGVLWATGKKDASLALIKESRPLLDKAVDLRPVLQGLGIKPRNGLPAVYAAVEGTHAGLPLFDSIVLLGRERTLARLRKARSLVS